MFHSPSRLLDTGRLLKHKEVKRNVPVYADSRKAHKNTKLDMTDQNIKHITMTRTQFNTRYHQWNPLR